MIYHKNYEVPAIETEYYDHSSIQEIRYRSSPIVKDGILTSVGMQFDSYASTNEWSAHLIDGMQRIPICCNYKNTGTIPPDMCYFTFGAGVKVFLAKSGLWIAAKAGSIIEICMQTVNATSHPKLPQIEYSIQEDGQ